jgi:hypothetical protein
LGLARGVLDGVGATGDPALPSLPPHADTNSSLHIRAVATMRGLLVGFNCHLLKGE